MSNREVITWYGKMKDVGRIGFFTLPERLVIQEVVLLVDAVVVADGHATCVLLGL